MLHTTENYIKEQQPWFINQKKKEKEQSQQQNQQQQQDSGQEDGGSNEDKMQTDGNQQDPWSKYPPDQREFLQRLQQEKEHMQSLKVNDGQGVCPIKDKTYPEEIDEKDQFTPDNWVARYDRLIRLTGKHPLNGEPALTELYEAGFTTPNRLHYVRNHGSVPHILWESHKIEISAGKTVSLGMDNLRDQFRSINIPVFLACDGNRRKELNMIRRSKGFNFGAGAVGCAYWKGALLREVLIAADVSSLIQKSTGKRLWVNFEGADELSNGKYATSIPLEYAIDTCNDVMLAFGMNDLPLPPDHGYPVRVLIPGFAGGRCVKWLSRIWITDHENDSYYHIYDNRVLPGFVTSSDSDFAEIMYHHPSTIINQQTVNSVIVRPAHGEKMALGDILQGQTYRIQGFAYSGAGEEIQIVEVSLDEGCNWLYCSRRVGSCDFPYIQA